MKAVLFAGGVLIAIALAGSGLLIASRQRNAFEADRRRLEGDVRRLEEELRALRSRPEADALTTYRNPGLGFELEYPAEAFSGRPARATDAVSPGGLPGVHLSQADAPCFLEVYVGSADLSSDPFDESGVDPKLKRVAASRRLVSGSLAYHVGVSVVSHAVDPERTCVPLLERVLSTFRVVPASPATGFAAELGAGRGLAPYEARALHAQGMSDPEGELRSDLMERGGDLIPYSGVLGGRLGFHDPGGIAFLPGRVVLARFDDGHVEGRALLSWALGPGVRPSWRLLSSDCPDCLGKR